MSSAGEPLVTAQVPIDQHCVGDRWVVKDPNQLARLIAIVAMGQALHAREIIHTLEPAAPLLTNKELLDAARQQLQIRGANDSQRDSSRWRRDGFIFEVVSWIAARLAHGDSVLLKDPHLKSTTQGIDGLMLELDANATEIAWATLFEDKCTERPRDIFRDDVMKVFHEHHENKRGPELIATAASLIAGVGLTSRAATQAAERVLDKEHRRYRAALTIDKSADSQDRRRALFKDYDELNGITQDQRVGATLVVEGDLRQFFDDLAAAALAALAAWEKVETSHV
ncbi:MAG: hypothetical protein KGJ78_17775 [Alphaproteobacteria bacterium]|nr:hypothetical protein [Alphaproteobacteria bacterium]